METVLKTPNINIIINGGQTFKDCPKTQEESWKWADKANKGKEEPVPMWKWDCGYKLDFDGSVIEISSRFYPPSEFYGDTWDGKSRIYLNGKEIITKEFDCETLEQLRQEVEIFSGSITDAIKKALQNLS